MKINKALLASYGRHLAGAILAGIVTVSSSTGKVPTAWTADEWMVLLNTLWVAAVPVIGRWINPKDPAFGNAPSA
jgi:hypothetical protein